MHFCEKLDRENHGGWVKSILTLYVTAACGQLSVSQLKLTTYAAFCSKRVCGHRAVWLVRNLSGAGGDPLTLYIL